MPKLQVSDPYYRYIDLRFAVVKAKRGKAYVNLDTSIIEKSGDIQYFVAKLDVIDSPIPLPTAIKHLLLLTAETS